MEKIYQGLSRRTRHHRGMAGARHGMCELTARHGRGTAWARHAVCESALMQHRGLSGRQYHHVLLQFFVRKQSAQLAQRWDRDNSYMDVCFLLVRCSRGNRFIIVHYKNERGFQNHCHYLFADVLQGSKSFHGIQPELGFYLHHRHHSGHSLRRQMQSTCLPHQLRKVHPITYHDGPEGEYRHSSTLL